MKRRIFVWLLVSALLTLTVAGDVYAAEAKLTASDGAADDQFGESVAISGDYAIVGAWGDDDNGLSSGSAYIFYYNGSSWSQQAKLTASDGAEQDRFGASVAISGDYAIVGAYGDDIGENDNQGSAYVFQRSGESWSQQVKLTASDGALGDCFGESVAISGDYAIVGAYMDDDNGADSGSAYVFQRSGESWSEQVKLTAGDGAASDYFGESVAISGDYAIVGAYRDDDNGESSGSAYIFQRSGESWSQQAKLTADDGAEQDRFGWSVAISGDYAIVGAWGDDSNQGSAYIFQRSGESWSQQAKLTAGDGAADDCFGDGVGISGNYAIVGADCDNSNQGSAYCFLLSGGTWSETGKQTASDGAAEDYFGWSVAISGDYAIVGAGWDDVGDNVDQGSAYIYDFPLGLYACDASGNLREQFVPGEKVYVKGNSLPASTDYKLWIQDNPVSESDTLSTGEDPSGAQETTATNSGGTLAVTELWSIPAEAPVTHHQYDIVADNQDTGTVGTYNAASDALDSAAVFGFEAPVPELPTIVLLCVGLLGLGGYLWFRRGSKKSALGTKGES